MSNSPCIDILIRYLLQSGPEDWHQIALHWNWDQGNAPLWWIIQQSTCDRGTALLLYWRGGPPWYTRYATHDDVPDWARPGFDLVQTIETRYLAEGYTRQEIAYDPRNDDGMDHTVEFNHNKIRRPIPMAMTVATEGKTLIDLHWDDGLPPEVYAECDELYP